MRLPKFDYTLDYKNLNLREHPELYRTGKGEQGVLLVEPYKSEILPYWRFKTPEIARESADKIYDIFLGYKKQEDFIGMDMARKFLQMGYTRSRRYATIKTGGNTMDRFLRIKNHKAVLMVARYYRDKLMRSRQSLLLFFLSSGKKLTLTSCTSSY